MTWHPFLLAAASAFALAACGSTISGGDSGGGGSGGSAVGTDGFPLSCSAGSFAQAWIEQDGDKYICQTKPGSDVEYDAVVTGVTADTLQLDRCAPNADCTAQPAVVGARGLGLDLSFVPVGAFVHVHFILDHGGAQGECHVNLRVTNLAAFGGVPNPVSSSSFIWLLALSTIEIAYQAGTDFGIAPESVSCSSGSTTDDLRLFDPDAPDNAVTVPVGQHGSITVTRDGAAQTWTLGNLMSGCGKDFTYCNTEHHPADAWLTEAPAP